MLQSHSSGQTLSVSEMPCPYHSVCLGNNYYQPLDCLGQLCNKISFKNWHLAAAAEGQLHPKAHRKQEALGVMDSWAGFVLWPLLAPLCTSAYRNWRWPNHLPSVLRMMCVFAAGTSFYEPSNDISTLLWMNHFIESFICKTAQCSFTIICFWATFNMQVFNSCFHSLLIYQQNKTMLIYTQVFGKLCFISWCNSNCLHGLIPLYAYSVCYLSILQCIKAVWTTQNHFNCFSALWLSLLKGLQM